MAESYCSECNEGLYEPSIEDAMEHLEKEIRDLTTVTVK